MRFRSMLSELRPDWNVKVIAGSVSGAVKWFHENKEPDLMLLDIQLSDGNSFLFLEEIKPHCPVIFTTAYDEYAIRAFSVNSIDYLLKPFDEQRLEEAIKKFESLKNFIPPADELIEALKSISTKKKKYRTRFLVNGANKSEMLHVDDIAYFYSLNKITFAVTKSAEEAIIDLPLDKLEQQLNPDSFFRANRQFILNIESIRKIEPYFGGKISVTVMPKTQEVITVSKENAARFKQWLNY